MVSKGTRSWRDGENYSPNLLAWPLPAPDCPGLIGSCGEVKLKPGWSCFFGEKLRGNKKG